MVAKSTARVAAWMLTHESVGTMEYARVRPNNAGAWGLGRSARHEAPLLPLRFLDNTAVSRQRCGSQGQQYTFDVAAPLCIRDPEDEIIVVAGTIHSSKLTPARQPPGVVQGQTASWQIDHSTEMLSGGTGGLGLITAEWLTQKGDRPYLVLASRRGTLASKVVEKLRMGGAVGVHVQCCNIMDNVEVCVLLGTISCSLPPVSGIWHTAGVLSDGLLLRQGSSTLQRTYAPKEGGARICTTRMLQFH